MDEDAGWCGSGHMDLGRQVPAVVDVELGHGGQDVVFPNEADHSPGGYAAVDASVGSDDYWYTNSHVKHARAIRCLFLRQVHVAAVLRGRNVLFLGHDRSLEAIDWRVRGVGGVNG